MRVYEITKEIEMKLTYNTNEDMKELRNLTQDWILSRKGQIMSGLSCRRLFADVYGIDIDHHVYAYTLDYLRNIEAIKFHAHNDGDTQYLV